MNEVVHMRRDLTAPQVALIRRTVAKDCNEDEFSLFMAAAMNASLDPLRKQISALVFSKNDPKKRQLAIITNIDGMRVIAHRCGDYRPMETAPVIEYDAALKNVDTNPLGIASCTVTCWKRDAATAQWFPVAGIAHWDEFVPLEQDWAYDEAAGKRTPSGPKKLPANSPWRRMARVMIAKCAEAQALRRGWPDHLSGLYGEEEMQRAEVIDVASEVVADYEERQRIARVSGGKSTALFVFEAGGKLEAVERGQIADRLASFYRGCSHAQQVIDFRDRNAESLKTFWAWEPRDALDIKKLAEERIADLVGEKKQAGDFPGDRA